MVQSKISFPSLVSVRDHEPCHTAVTNIPIASVLLPELTSKTGSSASNSPSTSSTTSPINYIHEYDIATYREKAKSMTDSEIDVLIKNLFKPDKSYSFPATNGRRFHFEWLGLYPWLCYSPSQDGAYCLPCVLFGDR